MVILFKLKTSQQLALSYKHIVSCALLLALIATSCIYPKTSLADSHGITITPSKANIEIAPDQSSYRHTIILINNTDAEVDLGLNSKEFDAQRGGEFFQSFNVADDWQSGQSASWINVAPQQIRLEPKQQVEVVVTINNTPDLSPGGHYAAILAQISSADDVEDISLNQIVSSLLFVTKKGGEVYEVTASNLESNISWWGMVKDVEVKFTNSGNTHVVPRGRIVLTDPLNRQVASGIINPASTIILPGTDQNFRATLSQLKQLWWPGMYQLNLSYRHQNQDDYQQLTKSVFIPGIVLSAALCLIVVLGIGFLARYVHRRSNSS